MNKRGVEDEAEDVGHSGGVPKRTRFICLQPTAQDPADGIDDEMPGSVTADVEPLVLGDKPFAPYPAGDPGLSASHLARDPGFARAQRRLLRQTRAEGGVRGELAAAEEQYDQLDEPYNEVGVPLEPFHLRREREEGMITGEGFYLEADRPEEHDAWVESLEEQPGGGAGPPTAVLGVGEDAGGQGPPANEPVAEPPPLSPAELAPYRKRLAALLQPGEAVPAALRRLAGAGATFEAKFASKDEARAFFHAREHVGHTVPPGCQALFDQIAEAAEVLMDAGVGDAYTKTREQFAKEARAGEGGGAAATPPAVSPRTPAAGAAGAGGGVPGPAAAHVHHRAPPPAATPAAQQPPAEMQVVEVGLGQLQSTPTAVELRQRAQQAAAPGPTGEEPEATAPEQGQLRREREQQGAAGGPSPIDAVLYGTFGRSAAPGAASGGAAGAAAFAAAAAGAAPHAARQGAPGQVPQGLQQHHRQQDQEGGSDEDIDAVITTDTVPGGEEDAGEQQGNEGDVGHHARGRLAAWFVPAAAAGGGAGAGAEGWDDVLRPPSLRGLLRELVPEDEVGGADNSWQEAAGDGGATGRGAAHAAPTHAPAAADATALVSEMQPPTGWRAAPGLAGRLGDVEAELAREEVQVCGGWLAGLSTSAPTAVSAISWAERTEGNMQARPDT
eukprot:scaffold10.g2401.t1